MSVINALDRLHAYRNAHPSVDLERAASVLRAGPVSVSTFDYDQAILIMRHWPAVANINDGPRVTRIREIVASLIQYGCPPWAFLIPRGRRYLAAHLTPNVKQVFDAAGLYGPSDDASVRAWWDGLAQMIRSASAESRTELGRRGEALTIERERRVLAEAGRVDLRPEAVAFEDNTLGYDVRSFTITCGGVRPKYIEAKATEALPLRFYLTRNEWRVALRKRDDYFVHLWYLPKQQLVEIGFAELSAHAPLDQGRGEWETVIIRWE